MSDKFLISVIIPIFNRKEFLGETIESVLSQSDPSFELILVDDGSTDGAAEIAADYSIKDERVSLIRRPNTRKKGANVCRNIGLENSMGDYVIFLDSDDLLAPFCIETRRKTVLEFYNLDFCVFPMLLFKESLDDLKLLQNINTGEDALKRFLSRENVWLMSSVLWRKDFIQRLGGFNEDLISFQDWEINVRALCTSHNFVFFDQMKPDNYYRQHGNTISANRYGLIHTVNNLEMVFSVFEWVKITPKYSEEKRALLAGFFVDLINRYRYFPLSKQQRREEQKRWINQGLSSGLVDEFEAKNIIRYLSIARSYWSSRFSFVRKFNEKKFRNGTLQHFFPVTIKKQGKIRYDGPLN